MKSNNSSDKSTPHREPTSGSVSKSTKAGTQTLVTKTTKKTSRRRVFAAVVLVVIVLLGSGAAAYFGIVVPNKPENVLKKAVTNLSQQKRFSVKGNISMTGDNVANANIDVKMLHIDTSQQAVLLDSETSLVGIKLPIEVRYLDQNAYVKIGDLATLKALVGSIGGSDITNMVDVINEKLSNQWVEIDKTTRSEAAGDCQKNTFALMSSDVSQTVQHLLQDDQYPYFSVSNTSKDTVDGVETTKFAVNIDTSRLAAYGKKLAEQLPANQTSTCHKSPSTSKSQSTTAVQQATNDTSVEAFNIWVDGSKHVKRIQLKLVTMAGGSKSDVAIDFRLLDQDVTIEKPANAKPVMQLMRELNQQFGGTSTLDPSLLRNSLSL